MAPKGPLVGSWGDPLGPKALRASKPEKTPNDIMALRVRRVATELHSKGAAVVPQRDRE